MVQIANANDVATLINIFTVSPRNQQKLVDLLLAATKNTMRHLPGFLSASIHKSADGVRVANYAQWRRPEDFEAMLKNAAALLHMKEINEIAAHDAHLYSVVDCIEIAPATMIETAR